MRRLRTLRSIISALLLTCFVSSFAQSRTGKPLTPVTKDTVRHEGPRHKYPLFNGVMVGVNVADPVMRLMGQDYGAYEGLVEVNLHNRFFPEWSFGVGSGSKTTDDGLHYNAKSAFFNRFGMNYNFRYNKSSKDFFVVGLRYGVSSYSADITSGSFNDGYWEPTENINLTDQKFTSHWMEVNVGIRVNVWKGLSMGWNIRMKYLLKEGSTPNANPWYIPGYGPNGSNFGFNYNIYYQLPFGGKAENK